MILRSIQYSATCRVRTNTPSQKYSAFYLRFYHAVTALQEHDAETLIEHSAQPIYRATQTSKLNLLLPRRVRQNTCKLQHNADIAVATQLETGLFSTARLLKSVDHTVSHCKINLKAAYDAQAKRRRQQSSGATEKIDLGSAEPGSVKLREDITRLENILDNNQLRVKPNHALQVNLPRISSKNPSSKALDNDIHDLLRLPLDGQLSALADLLASTRVAPTIKTFNIMISRLTRLRQNAAAWMVFRAMLRMNYAPDEYTLSSVLNLCIVSGSYANFCSVLLAARAQRKITKSREGNQRADNNNRRRRGLVLLSTIIKGCIKFGRFRRAEVYYTLLWSERAKPNLTIMTLMLQGYRETRNWEKGRHILRRMLLFDQWDRKAVVALLAYCQACKQPLVESKIREVAILKGVTIKSGEDLAILPSDTKTKGLNVPDHFKRPTRGDIGALDPKRLQMKNELRKSLKTERVLFTGKRRVALGKWA